MFLIINANIYFDKPKWNECEEHLQRNSNVLINKEIDTQNPISILNLLLISHRNLLYFPFIKVLIYIFLFISFECKTNFGFGFLNQPGKILNASSQLTLNNSCIWSYSSQEISQKSLFFRPWKIFKVLFSLYYNRINLCSESVYMLIISFYPKCKQSRNTIWQNRKNRQKCKYCFQ